MELTILERLASVVDNLTRSYLYSYDFFDRILGAAYGGGKPGENYALENMSYDKNGNIKTLGRKGMTAGTPTTPTGFGNIDQLTYTYANGGNSNQLLKVDDEINGNINVGDFRDVAGNDYDYWADGSLKKDNNKEITNINYNHLKLTTEVTLTGNRKITTWYDALGHKLRKETLVNNVVQERTDYHGAIIYQTLIGQPQKVYQIAHEEGRAIPHPTLTEKYIHEFSYKDHLGNLRLSFRDSLANNNKPIITQQNAFDPWGLSLTGIDYVKQSGVKDKFGFNGIEFNDLTKTFDAKFRSLDAQTGRWWGIDPKPDYSISSYASIKNNPISYTDPLGDTTVVNNYGVMIHQYGNDNFIFQQGNNGKLTQIGEFGKSINLNGILPNILKDNRKEAKKMGAWSFANAVRPGGKWDYKNIDIQKGNIFGKSAQYEKDTDKKTSFTYGTLNFLEGGSDVGNFNYGYTGRYAGGEGFSHSVLWSTGGPLQIGKDFLKLNWGKAISEMNSVIPIPVPPFGDELDDFIWITTGMKQADDEKKNNND